MNVAPEIDEDRTDAEFQADYDAAVEATGCPPDQISNFARASIVFQHQQLAFASAARLCDEPDGPTEIGMGGARMGGKSHAMICQIGADDCIRRPGLKALMLRKAGTSGKESFEALLPKTIGGLGTYVPSQNIFRLKNGSWIKLGHFQNESDIDKYLSLEYDVIGIEEATTLSYAKKKAIQSCCRSPVGSGWRARLYYSTNPGGVGHAWFKKLFIEPFRKGVEKETRFIPATVDDNNFATPEYRKFLDGLTGWLKRAWRYGDWDIAAGQFFTTWNRAIHVSPEPIVIPRHWRVWLSFDYGFTHFTSCHLFAQDGDGNIYIVDEHAERRWLPERHAVAIKAMVERNNVEWHRIEAIAAGHDIWSKDRNGKCTAEDYDKLGLEMTRAKIDRVNGAAEILRRLGDAEANIPSSILIDERCVRLIECLPSMEHDPHHPEDVLKVDTDENGLGGDDHYDSARYGIMCAAVNAYGSWGANPLA